MRSMALIIFGLADSGALTSASCSAARLLAVLEFKAVFALLTLTAPRRGGSGTFMAG
jgi:hypothetical protein